MKRTVLLLSTLLFCTQAYGQCKDASHNKSALDELTPDFSLSTVVSSCPVKNSVIRKPDVHAKQGGGFLARRGANRCHFALDLEVFNGLVGSGLIGLGEPVYAAGAGKVVISHKKWGKSGKTVMIDHGNQYYSLYGHLDSISVKKGSSVESGQKIGKVGYSGNSKNLKTSNLPPHLHFVVFRTMVPVTEFKPISVVKETEKINDDIPFFDGFGFIDPSSWLRTIGCLS